MRECLRVHACEGPDAGVRASPPATLLADAFPVANPARPVRQCTDVPKCSTYDAACKCTACTTGVPVTGGSQCVSAWGARLRGAGRSRACMPASRAAC